MRNAVVHAGQTQRRIVAAWIGTAFAETEPEAARRQWRQVADQARPRVPKLAAWMNQAEADVIVVAPRHFAPEAGRQSAGEQQPRSGIADDVTASLQFFVEPFERGGAAKSGAVRRRKVRVGEPLHDAGDARRGQ